MRRRTDSAAVERGTFEVITYDNDSSEHERHRELMGLAIDEANMAVPQATSFRVGAVLINGNQIISTGHTDERNTPQHHAAAIAIQKGIDSRHSELLVGSTLYTTMEPCSMRTWSHTPCTDRIKKAGLKTVVIGVKEPTTFENCNGVEELRTAGIDVVQLKFLEEECLRTNIHLLQDE